MYLGEWREEEGDGRDVYLGGRRKGMEGVCTLEILYTSVGVFLMRTVKSRCFEKRKQCRGCTLDLDCLSPSLIRVRIPLCTKGWGRSEVKGGRGHGERRQGDNAPAVQLLNTKHTVIKHAFIKRTFVLWGMFVT